MVATCKEKGCELKTEMDEEGKSHTNITAYCLICTLSLIQSLKNLD